MSRPDLIGKYACRLCRHDQYEHNLTFGCPHCWCMATPGEAAARSDAEDRPILPPGEYLPVYTPKQPEPDPSPVGDAFYRVWWALGGYKHYDTMKEAHEAKHPKGGQRAEIDEPVRIDKIEIVFYDPEAEARVQRKRRERIIQNQKGT